MDEVRLWRKRRPRPEFGFKTARQQIVFPYLGIGREGARSNFGVEVEERVDAVAQLGLDFFARAFEDVHSDARPVPVLKDNRGVADFRDFIGGEESHSVNQGQVSHVYSLEVCDRL